MSELAVRCVDLPVREEPLSGAMLAQVQGGGFWWWGVKKVVEIGVTGYLYEKGKARVVRAKDWCVDQWEEYQAEADTEALAQSRHEFRRAYFNKAG